MVAIDGPAGSGKSTTARECACRLGFHYLDTGAMYRAMALKVIAERAKERRRRTKSPTAETRFPISHRSLRRLLGSTAIEMSWRQGVLTVSLDGRDVTEEIRQPRVSALVSEVSAIPMVRRKMVAEQRRIADETPNPKPRIPSSLRGIVCEGRDIGSVVFPDADLKVFLDCGIRERSRRRLEELRASGMRAKGGAVLANLAKRDRIDSSRRVSPLLRTPDAVLVDTTMLSIEEQVRVICTLVRKTGT